MYKINDYIMYKNEVCKITDINPEKKLYIMHPLDDESLTISYPISNDIGYIKDLMSVNEAKKLIDNIPNIEEIKESKPKNLENIYKDLLKENTHQSLIKIIKTSYIRNQNRINNRKKISDNDDKYFKLAEKYLYNELSIVLNMSYEDAKNYVITRVQYLTK